MHDVASSHRAATVSTETLKKDIPTHVRAEDTKLGRGGFGPWKAPLLVIVAELAVLAYLIRGSFFYADDYQAFGLARYEGFGATLLFTPGYGNLAPTERFLHWLPLSFAPLNYGLGEAIILALTAAVLVSLLWVLRELRADPVVTLTAIFIVGTSTVVLYEAFDYDQVTFLFPASACILCVMALFVRWIRTGSTLMLVASWVVFGLSFFTQERLLLLPLYLVIVRYLVLPYRMPPRGHRKPWADWRVWTPFAAIGLAYYGYYRGLAEHSHPDYGTTITFLRLAVQVFLRTLLGLPVEGVPRWLIAVEWLAILGILVAVLIASRVKSRRRALLGATVFVVLTFVANLVAVYQGTGGVLGISGIVPQLQYYLDPMLALALGVGLASSPLASASEPLTGRPISDPTDPATISLRSPLVIGCAVVVILHIALLPFGLSNVLDSQSGQRFAASWVPTVRSSLSAADRARTPTTILPLTMPATFVPGFEAPFQLEKPFLALLPEWRNSESGPVRIIGPTGHLELARAAGSVSMTGPEVTQHLGPAYGLSSHVNSSGDTCFTAKSAGGQFRIVLPQTVSGDQLAVDIHLSTTHPLRLTPLVSSPKVTINAFPETMPAGDHRLIAALQGTPAGTIGFIGLSEDAEFCVLGVQVAAVGVGSPQSDECQAVDVYGTPTGSREPCGEWQ
jgi:hypothetical protein